MVVNYDFDIEESKDGYKILKVYKDDKKIYIGSKYRMKETIDKLIDKSLCDESIVIVFGIGSGEYLKEVYNRFKNIKLIIFEPNINVRNYVIKNIHQYTFMKNKNVYLLNGENEEEIYKELAQIIGEFDISEILYRWIINYDRIYEKEILEFSMVLKKFISDITVCRNTNIIFSKRWFDTLIYNFKYMIQSTPINLLKDKYEDIPAIIVSAGPSLSKNIDHLKNINNDVMILTGGRTLRTLEEKNIEPNLIGVVDPADISYKLVKGYIEKTKAPLLFYEGTNETVVEKHKGKKIFFTQNYTINNIFDMNIENLGLGGSVAHTLTAAAAFMGCNPIIFIGQDLAYTGEKYHADIAINQFSNIKNNKIIIGEKYVKDTNGSNVEFMYVEDINGERVRTSRVLDGFRRELETIIENNEDITFINATEGGAKIKGTIQMTLKEAIKKYKVEKNIGYLQCDNELDRQKIKQKALESLEKIIEADEKIIDECKNGLRIIQELKVYIAIEQRSKIDRCLKELDNIDKTVKEKYGDLDILKSIIYPIIYDILSCNKPKSDKEIIEKNKYLYESILNISKEVLKPIKKAKLDIEKMGI